MNLKLIRKWFTDTSTTGELYVDGTYECFTLEDPVMEDGIKIPGETAVPTGTYKVVMYPSNRFKRIVPLLLEVPGFSFIEIHIGNTARDTKGCILVGRERGEDIVTSSKMAFNALMDKIITSEDLSIEIVEERV